MQRDRPIGPPPLHTTVKLGDASLLPTPRPQAYHFDAKTGPVTSVPRSPVTQGVGAVSELLV
jgi:hypothetical protein